MFVKKERGEREREALIVSEELASSAVNIDGKSYENINVKLLRRTFFCQHKL